MERTDCSANSTSVSTRPNSPGHPQKPSILTYEHDPAFLAAHYFADNPWVSLSKAMFQHFFPNGEEEEARERAELIRRHNVFLHREPRICIGVEVLGVLLIACGTLTHSPNLNAVAALLVVGAGMGGIHFFARRATDFEPETKFDRAREHYVCVSDGILSKSETEYCTKHGFKGGLHGKSVYCVSHFGCADTGGTEYFQHRERLSNEEIAVLAKWAHERPGHLNPQDWKRLVFTFLGHEPADPL